MQSHCFNRSTQNFLSLYLNFFCYQLLKLIFYFIPPWSNIVWNGLSLNEADDFICDFINGESVAEEKLLSDPILFPNSPQWSLSSSRGRPSEDKKIQDFFGLLL